MNVSVIGTGYVGIVSGACLAAKGHRVTCVDIDETKVQKINEGAAPIYEIGLEELLRASIGRNLFASTDLRAAVLGSELTLIAVGTPFDGKMIDLSFVRQVSEQIGHVLRDKQSYHVVVVKSTVVPGTTDEVVVPILESASSKKAGKDFGVGMNPEFLTEGQAVADFMNPDRIVLGGIDDRSIDQLAMLYDGFVDVQKLRTNTRTAEMIKYASNALLATMISFSNEIANLGSALGGIDAVEVMNGVQASAYLTLQGPAAKGVKAPISSFLYAGCGFGGSCLPKDVSALIAHGEHAGLEMPLLRAVIKTNKEQPGKILDLLRTRFPSLAGLRIAVLGLAFKPDTDDMRESPAIPIIRSLRAANVVVTAYDPVAMSEAKRIFASDGIAFASTLKECVQGVDAVVLVTSWNEFEGLPALLKEMPTQPVVVDGRRMLRKSSVDNYLGIGL